MRLAIKSARNRRFIKILAAYHQYFAVKKAVEKTKEATAGRRRPENRGRLAYPGFG